MVRHVMGAFIMTSNEYREKTFTPFDQGANLLLGSFYVIFFPRAYDQKRIVVMNGK